MNLRPRDRSKELNGEFRFKARSSIERVMDRIRDSNPIHMGRPEQLVSNHLQRKLGNQSVIVLNRDVDMYQLRKIGANKSIHQLQKEKMENMNARKNKSLFK